MTWSDGKDEFEDRGSNNRPNVNSLCSDADLPPRCSHNFVSIGLLEQREADRYSAHAILLRCAVYEETASLGIDWVRALHLGGRECGGFWYHH